jgi:dienelactone hydrolase
LAVGLAAKGIAVLRYDKVTYEHTFKVASDPKFTLKKETADDAISAVKLLKQTPKIDARHIFVAGHSQGGFAMPLIIDADQAQDIAGAILLAGPSFSMADSIIDQQRELIERVKRLGQDTAPYEQQAAGWISLAKLMNDPQYTVDHLPENFPLPAYWYFEQKGYSPIDLAQKQHTPMLILQGENDWQVTMKQFNQWKSALQNRNDVEFKSYPKMNHILADYDGISTGAEYGNPSNVSSELITDIAAWIQKRK